MSIRFYRLAKWAVVGWLTISLISCTQKAKPDHIKDIIAIRSGPDTLRLYMVLANAQDSAIAADGHYYYYLTGDLRRLYGNDKAVRSVDFGMYALDENDPTAKTMALQLGSLIAEDFKKWPSYEPDKTPPLELDTMEISLDFATKDNKLTKEAKLITKRDPI